MCHSCLSPVLSVPSADCNFVPCHCDVHYFQHTAASNPHNKTNNNNKNKKMSCFACLEQNEQVLVTECTGGRYIENGPGCICINPCSDVERRNAVILSAGQRAVIFNDEDGNKRCVYGPHVEFLGARDQCQSTAALPTLSPLEYVVVTDTTNGKKKNVVGPCMYEIGAYEDVSAAKQVYNLSRNEYVRIKDQDGKKRVERGEKKIVPLPSETIEGGVMKAINIDDHHAVLVRNTDTGSLLLLVEHGLFFPTPYQEIVAVQEKIILEEYQSVVYKDETGRFHFVHGDSDMRDFFLPPFAELVTQEWSTDLRKEHTSIEKVWKFDRRAEYMNYEFNCRTVDNVELVVDVSFFWSIIDVRLLVQKTADAPGDTCTHARSRIIQAVSRLKLLDFLENFNEVIRTACIGDTFYEERGVNLISVEVLKFKCASRDTDSILQEIIQETADRLKKRERQKGENEVALARLGGEIEEEKMKKDLIELRKSHLKTEARIEGEAEALKLTAFLERSMENDNGGGLNMQSALDMFLTLRKLDSIQTLSEGASQIYLTPNDVNLSVGQMFPALGPRPQGGSPF